MNFFLHFFKSLINRKVSEPDRIHNSEFMDPDPGPLGQLFTDLDPQPLFFVQEFDAHNALVIEGLLFVIIFLDWSDIVAISLLNSQSRREKNGEVLLIDCWAWLLQTTLKGRSSVSIGIYWIRSGESASRIQTQVLDNRNWRK